MMAQTREVLVETERGGQIGETLLRKDCRCLTTAIDHGVKERNECPAQGTGGTAMLSSEGLNVEEVSSLTHLK